MQTSEAFRGVEHGGMTIYPTLAFIVLGVIRGWCDRLAEGNERLSGRGEPGFTGSEGAFGIADNTGCIRVKI